MFGFNSLIASCSDHANAILHGLPTNQINRLQRLQNSAVRLVTQKRNSLISPPY